MFLSGAVESIRIRVLTIFLALGFYAIAGQARAGYFDDIGFTPLQSEVGAALPDGTGLRVTIVEACTGNPCAWAPDPGARSITVGDGGPAVAPPYSGHATTVGNLYFGDDSTTPGIGIAPSPSIAGWRADEWLTSEFLQLLESFTPPSMTASRVASHAYVGGFGDPVVDLNGLRRLDWLVDRDEYVQVGGFIGNDATFLASAFNAIIVHATSGTWTAGSQPVSGDAAYAAVRTRPQLVTPETSSSTATGRVASAAALLIDTAQENPGLSNGSTTNRNGDTVWNAERAEVVKAALMAGADRATRNTHPASTPFDIVEYRVDPADQTSNGLDRRYGAGQLSIYNSYYVITAGEQDSAEDGGPSNIADFGFDYDAAFGGSSGSNSTGTYYFSTANEAVEFFASLVWNVRITPGATWAFSQAATLYNIDLQLYDVSDMGNWVLVQQSASTVDNTENIRARLDSNTDYALRVTRAAGQGSFNWDYGIAWRSLVPGDVDGDRDVDVTDAMLLQKAVTGDIVLSQPQHSRADVHPDGGDGSLTVADVLAAQKIAMQQ